MVNARSSGSQPGVCCTKHRFTWQSTHSHSFIGTSTDVQLDTAWHSHLTAEAMGSHTRSSAPLSTASVWGVFSSSVKVVVANSAGDIANMHSVMVVCDQHVYNTTDILACCHTPDMDTSIHTLAQSGATNLKTSTVISDRLRLHHRDSHWQASSAESSHLKLRKL